MEFRNVFGFPDISYDRPLENGETSNLCNKITVFAGMRACLGKFLAKNFV